jgi:hypothetical protein
MTTRTITISMEESQIADLKALTKAIGTTFSGFLATAAWDAMFRESARLCDQYDAAHPEEAAEMVAWDRMQREREREALQGAEWTGE